jgi:hypothetical protein
MDQMRFAELTLRHRHSDGSWSPLEPRPERHDPAELDPERDWPSGQLYACPTCDEQVLVEAPRVEDPHQG